MRYTKKQVEDRVKFLNELTGKNFICDYAPQYGGWSMYEKLPSGGCARSYFGFDDRKSTKEFMEYLYGINTALCWVNNKINENK